MRKSVGQDISGFCAEVLHITRARLALVQTKPGGLARLKAFDLKCQDAWDFG